MVWPNVYPPFPESPENRDTGQRRDIETLFRRSQTPQGGAAVPFFIAEVTDLAGTNPNTNAEQSFSMDPSYTQWATEDGSNAASETFDLGQAAPAGDYGVKILKNGLYIGAIWSKIVVPSAPAADSVGMIGMTGSNYNVGGQDRAPFLKDPAGTTYSSQPNRIMFFNLDAAAVTPPYFTWPAIAQNTGADLTGRGLTLILLRMNDTLADNF